MTKFLRKIFGNFMSKVGSQVALLGIHPNTITFIGVLGNCLAAGFIANGNLICGGIFGLFSGLMDALDGAVSRAEGTPNRFGSLIDSVSDRYSEIFIYFGLLFYTLDQNDHTGIMLVFTALSGSILVSYVRARAESLNVECKVGIMTRLERYLVTIVLLLSGFVHIGLIIISILSHITAFHRMYYVWRQLEKAE
jgi:CDP-diacylglycerol--glycerol-3-phosphate 3-phosphatidyltransferase